MVATMYKQLDTVVTGIDPWNYAPNEDLSFLSTQLGSPPLEVVLFWSLGRVIVDNLVRMRADW